jgi:hypothetical protein
MMHRRFLFGAHNTGSVTPPPGPIPPVPLPPVPVRPPFPYSEDHAFRGPETPIFDYYGRCVALNADGTVFVVGSDETSLNSVNNGTAGPGKVYVNVKSAGTWLEPQILAASDGAINDSFGESVAVSADGNTIVVGAPNAKIGSNTRQGAVYVFRRSFAGNIWFQSKKIVSSDGTPEDSFGYSVAISADGSTIAVGAIKDDILPTYSVGSVYTFNITPYTSIIGSITGSVLTVISTVSGTGKLSPGTLVSGSGIPADTFVSQLNPNGTYTLSAMIPAAVSNITIVGSVNWAQTAKLSASDARPDDNFGCSLSINSDGSYIAVGSYGSDVAAQANAGAVYFFTRQSSTYTETTKLSTNVPETNQRFGFSISMNNAATALVVGVPFYGNTSSNTVSATNIVPGTIYKISTLGTTNFTLIGAPSNTIGTTFVAIGVGTGTGTATSITPPNFGCVFVYNRPSITSVWTQRAQIVASDGITGDMFGYSVAIGANETFFTASSIGDDPSSVTGINDRGAAYVYTNQGTGWVQTAKLVASNGASGDQFGYSVAMAHDTLDVAVGAPTKSETTLAGVPVVNITQLSPITGPVPLTVTLSGTATNSPLEWRWDFENNGTVETVIASTTSPCWVYLDGGTEGIRGDDLLALSCRSTHLYVCLPSQYNLGIGKS